MRVLIIDDSRAMRAILRLAVKGFGGESVEASNGQEGLDRLEYAGPFDLALVDWNMPIMNGLEFVIAVRARSDWDSLRMVMVTTEVEMSQVSRALMAGAEEYVMKPFTTDILRDKLSMMGLLAA